VRNLRKFVESSMADVRELLATTGNPPLVRMALAKHIDAITIGPSESGAIEYKGNIKPLGDDSVSWDRAEGQNRSQSPMPEMAVPFEAVFGEAA
jgi:hypothetical protein